LTPLQEGGRKTLVDSSSRIGAPGSYEPLAPYGQFERIFNAMRELIRRRQAASSMAPDDYFLPARLEELARRDRRSVALGS
jgi:hypothetical protein